MAAFEVFTTHFLGHLLSHVSLENLEIHELELGRVERAVAERKVDLAITYAPVPLTGAEFVEVTLINMGIFGLAKFRSESFTDLPFVIPIRHAEGSPTKVLGLDSWPDHLIERKVRFQVAPTESAMELCREGHAVAFPPEFVVQIHNRQLRAEFRLEELEHKVPRKARREVSTPTAGG